MNRSDLTTQIPDFIRLAEADFEDRDEIQREARGTLNLTNQFTTLPTTLRELRSIRHDATNQRGPIELVPSDVLPEKKAIIGGTGIPRYAAVVTNGTEIEVAPVPDQTYTVNIKYLETLSRLSSTQSSNWVLSEHPDIYLYGALVHSAPFLKNDERLAVWEQRYEKALALAKRAADRRRYSTETLVRRPKRAIG